MYLAINGIVWTQYEGHLARAERGALYALATPRGWIVRGGQTTLARGKARNLTVARSAATAALEALDALHVLAAGE